MEQEIITLIKDILGHLGVGFDSVEMRTNELGTTYVIRTKDSGVLIGEAGETLSALSHIVRRITEKNGTHGDVEFSLDVNDYKAGMIDKLKIKANMLAERSRGMRADVELEPMSSYERLVVHGTLAGAPGVKTESIGEGKNRRVVIKYVGE
ncbi:MAG: KH domain-containing protein [Patescibacteria group bacterium]|nr:KH domain-containing protein [Patescibacteria group bacterium]MDE1945749.1 KH domain-containing protein [Patescibacteria group bacterium]